MNFRNFSQQTLAERLQTLERAGLLNAADTHLLQNSFNGALPWGAAKAMIENVIGVFGLPLGLGGHFVINQRAHVVPMVVEEPSIVAAISSAAKLVAAHGGFTSVLTESLLLGEVQVVGVKDLEQAAWRLREETPLIRETAAKLAQKMVARGGGLKEVSVVTYPGEEMLVVQLWIATGEAMGANVVNSLCEGLAPLLAQLAGGKALLKILSNLATRSLVKTELHLPVMSLTKSVGDVTFEGAEVAAAIVQANRLAEIDIFRAATHNKGIMNGIDAVALATGNDWRAIEAGAHAYAAYKTGQYTSLTSWRLVKGDLLRGELCLPIKVGTVGASLNANPLVPLSRKLLQVETAQELAEIFGAVGLAQNFAALRALATTGIQHGHMRLHARSVALAAKVPDELLPQVIEAMIEQGEIKTWYAEELTARLQPELLSILDPEAVGFGKVVLFGEHAVVYGSPALAVPLDLTISAKLAYRSATKRALHVARGQARGELSLSIPAWGVSEQLYRAAELFDASLKSQPLAGLLAWILQKLGLVERFRAEEAITLEVQARLPQGMGLGSSAALAVALLRAFSKFYCLGLDNEEINTLAWQAEQLAHGEASGIDNTVATYGQSVLYQRGVEGEKAPTIQFKKFKVPLHLVVGASRHSGSTQLMVAQVRQGFTAYPELYSHIFQQIAGLTREALTAWESGELSKLGTLMNICQGLLNALQVSTKELESLIALARELGALGAKLTGGGGGGCMLALGRDREHVEDLARQLGAAGYQAFPLTIG